ncbi:hypothetical protein ACW73L_08040 [Methylolobus aquaticus]
MDSPETPAQNMKPLVIATVFAPSPLNAEWYALQKKFIAACTEVAFDYWVVLNGVAPDGFDPSDIALVNEENIGHGEALMQLVELFRQRRNYENYLILDSDAFPVKPGWYRILDEQMNRLGKEVAAPVRAENLDVFPHPCAFFLRDRIVDDPRLEFRKIGALRNLLGMNVNDVGCATASMSDALFPLMRSNVVNVHPVAAAVYHHLFYHHGCGSRDFHFRVTKRFPYCEHWYDVSRQPAHGRRLNGAIMRNPERFIARLMGLNEPLMQPFLKDPVEFDAAGAGPSATGAGV